MKKSWIFSSMLALAFLFCLLPARNAQAANPQEVDLTGSYYTSYDITGDGPCALYVYGDGKLNRLLDFQTFFRYGSHNTGEVLKVSGNRLKVKLFSMSQAFAGIDLKYTYQYKNGRLAPVTKYGKVKVYKNYKYGRGKKVTARKSFWLHKSATSSKKKIRVNKGQKFRVEKCYVNGSRVRFKVKLTNGRTGWVKSPKRFLTKGPLIKESMYAG